MESIRHPVSTKKSRAEGKNLKDKIFAYLQLTRFPNLFTSMADVLAGYLMICTHICANASDVHLNCSNTGALWHHGKQVNGLWRPFLQSLRLRIWHRIYVLPICRIWITIFSGKTRRAAQPGNRTTPTI